MEKIKVQEVKKQPVHLKLVGDTTVGKTAMILAYKEKQFPEYLPRYAEANAVLTTENEKIFAIITEFHLQTDSPCYRRLKYHDVPTDCFLFCFALNDLSTYENLANRWYPEVKSSFPKIPIVLVGTKSDLQNKDDAGKIDLELCEELRDKLGAHQYIECSAKTREGLEEAFEESVRVARFTKMHSKKFCTVI